MLTRPYRAHDQVTYRPARTTRDALSNGFDWFTAPPTKASQRRADRAVMVACAIALIALALIAAHERGWFAAL